MGTDGWLSKDQGSWPKELDRLIDPAVLMKRYVEFGAIGRTESGGVTRPAFGPDDIRARRKVMDMMDGELGLEVSIDPWGNIIGRREGTDPGAPAVITGSHLDSVRNGGIFDGPAGVMAGYEAMRILDRLGLRPRHPFELVVFCAEEPNDFGMATIGSRGMVGDLRAEDLAGCKDTQGHDLLDAIAQVGGDPDNLSRGVRDSSDIKAFVELHIEQMPYLERSGKSIGIVEGVTGITRYRYQVRGRAGHAGTTPMNQRQDALVAAAELITVLNATGRKRQERAVATAGSISVSPNSVNTIPDRVFLGAEMRSYYPEDMEAMAGDMQTAMDRVRQTYGVEVTSERTYFSEPTKFSERVRHACRTACRKLECEYMSSISMAGHDAKHLAEITEAGMIFVPCRQGISHSPDEWSDPEDLAVGVKVLLTALLEIDNAPWGPERNAPGGKGPPAAEGE